MFAGCVETSGGFDHPELTMKDVRFPRPATSGTGDVVKPGFVKRFKFFPGHCYLPT
jgi:hypothetical protein